MVIINRWLVSIRPTRETSTKPRNALSQAYYTDDTSGLFSFVYDFALLRRLFCSVWLTMSNVRMSSVMTNGCRRCNRGSLRPKIINVARRTLYCAVTLISQTSWIKTLAVMSAVRDVACRLWNDCNNSIWSSQRKLIYESNRPTNRPRTEKRLNFNQQYTEGIVWHGVQTLMSHISI